MKSPHMMSIWKYCFDMQIKGGLLDPASYILGTINTGKWKSKGH